MTSVAPCTAPGKRPQHARRIAIQHRHRGDRAGNDVLGRATLLDGGADDAGAEPLGENQPIAGARARVGPDAIGIDGAGDGVAELHFGVAHRVAAEQRDAGLAQLVVAARGRSA